MDARAKQVYKGVDLLKWIMAILITVLHLKPTESYNYTMTFYLTNAITRIAVPTFFCITGFLVKKNDHNFGDKTYIKKFCLRWGKLYLFSTLLFVPWIIWDFAVNPRYSDYSLFMKLCIFIRRFFLNASVTPLWFFLAGIYAALMIFTLRSLHVDDRIIFCSFGLATFLVACFKDCYLPLGNVLIENIPYLGNLLDILHKVFGVVLPESFWAGFYILLGEKVSKLEKKESSKQSRLVFALIIFILLLLFEVYIIKEEFQLMECSKMITIVPISILLIMIFSYIKIGCSFQIIEFVRIQSIYIYIFHLFYSFYFGWIFSNSLLRYTILMVMTMVTSSLVTCLMKSGKNCCDNSGNTMHAK